MEYSMTGKNGLHHMFDRMKKYITLLHVQYERQNRIQQYIQSMLLLQTLHISSLNIVQ